MPGLFGARLKAAREAGPGLPGQTSRREIRKEKKLDGNLRLVKIFGTFVGRGAKIFKRKIALTMCVFCLQFSNLQISNISTNLRHFRGSPFFLTEGNF